MAETVKKAKAPAKPRAATTGTKETTTPKAAAPKATTAKASTKKATENSAPRVPTHEEIAHLARQYWVERGHVHGQDKQDWLRAEKELTNKAS